ncbi:Rrf2 family transcriptional regulator [Companilactobacillus alimentarius]|uniref:Transcriptional regulator n=1 Tax=Companilactobacillus alimentarius DSM 20249 TaxID=1423720 RepID=A0A2K9HK84_9LACO|nr:Rrf2 family transcriptional regulator [Companilactobacillus alimentarius]AUI72196.1 transcriptional regulator [Companilactobacillus alimentarius DSM 20249]KRK76332.1 transcription regulator [Companilactobacillus alimentarius DSM 20249]MDT6952739.1 Rrf2 family transcriptional regulator [Companilactobacillus alimentarius]MDT6952764.1 Rrf2 family transcriptional regulator [Companilactobacillus alimentarius]GEO45950.1 transcriptional regulator [Companilactobacillus alimentarius]
MKFSSKLSDGVHILAYVDICQDGDLSSNAIASSIESNPSLVRRMMSRLKKSGLLSSQPGKVAPKLGRRASEISLLDVYQAIEDNQKLLHIDEKTNPKCIVGGNIQKTLTNVYDQIQADAEKSMSKVTLQSIIDDILVNNKKKQELKSQK